MWALAALAGLLLITALVLSVPLDLRLRVDIDGRPKLRVALVWLFGLLSKDVEKGKKEPEEKAKPSKSKRKSKKKPGIRPMLQVLRTKGLLRQSTRLVTSILRCPQIKSLEADLRVGFDDPADTGMLFAVVGPATILLSSAYSQKIRLQPSFDKAEFTGHLNGIMRLQPILLFPPFLRFIFSLTTMRVLKTVISARWKSKK